MKYSDFTLPVLGSAIDVLYQFGKVNLNGEIDITAILRRANITSDSESLHLWGALYILHIMGLIRINSEGNIRIVSRQAHFALGSLSKYCKASIQVVDDPSIDEQEARYLVELTKALESMRMIKDKVDKDYLHERRVLNILIKGRQIHDGHKQDVYLHIFHPKWKAYHLLGIGIRNNELSIEELSRIAIEKNLSLLPHQYELDPLIKVDNIEETFLSGSLGTLTKYIISIRVIKLIKVDLNLRKKILLSSTWDSNTFRWFTLKEINQGYGNQNELIMYSSPLIFKRIASDTIPVSVEHAEYTFNSPKLKDVINSRFTKSQQLILSILIIISLLCIFWPHFIISIINIPNSQLQIYANYSQVFGAILSLVSLLILVIKGSE